MLEFAEKYNWWTPQKSSLSVEAKLEYILEKAPLEEILQALQEVGGEKLFSVWNERVKQKPLPKRKRVVAYFVEAHKNYKA